MDENLACLTQKTEELKCNEGNFNRIMEVRAECFKKAGSTPSDVPIETLIICTYCREKCYWIIKTKILRRLFYQRKKLTKTCVYPGAISCQVESLNFHFQSESKKATNRYHAVQ